MMMRRLAFAVFFVLSLIGAARAEERITSFQSEVTVNKDASLNVSELISVMAEGDRIRHGIFRDFPTRYKSASGYQVNAGFDVTAVKRDGQDEPYTIESISNGKRVKIGSADSWVSSGPHTYEIDYRATRELGFFD